MVLAEEIKTLIRDRYSVLIWVDCAEWEVLCSCLAFGQHIEKGGFPAIKTVRQESVGGQLQKMMMMTIMIRNPTLVNLIM